MVDLELWAVGKLRHGAETENGDGLGAVGETEQLAELLRIEDRHPAHAKALRTRGQPEVLDGARH